MLLGRRDQFEKYRRKREPRAVATLTGNLVQIRDKRRTIGLSVPAAREVR